MKTYDVVLALLKNAIWGDSKEPLCLDDDIAWSDVYQELRAQAVEGIVVDALPAVKNLDLQLKMEWLHRVTKNISYWNQLMTLQDEVIASLKNAEIPHVVLKGLGAAYYYQAPELRKMGDIDLQVKPEDFDRALQILLNAGFAILEEDDGRHVELAKGQFAVELHHHFASNSDQKAAALFDRSLELAIDRSLKMKIQGHEFSMLPKLENGLVLLAHMDQHMETGLGLRQIIDWMLFVDRELDDHWWESEFEQWTRRLGMHTLALTVTKMCQMFLGLRTEGISWCTIADAQLCSDLMELTMERGNFGIKLGDSKRAVPILGLMADITRIPVLLQESGCRNWKAIEKYPFLKSFAWLYQICRYIKQCFTRKHPIRRLLSEIQESRHQASVLEKLSLAKGTKKKLDGKKNHNR